MVEVVVELVEEELEDEDLVEVAEDEEELELLDVAEVVEETEEEDEVLEGDDVLVPEEVERWREEVEEPREEGEVLDEDAAEALLEGEMEVCEENTTPKLATSNAAAPIARADFLETKYASFPREALPRLLVF